MPDESFDAPKDIRLLDIPGYLEWSKEKLRQGESEAIMSHMDGSAMWLKHSELNAVTPDEFEEMLDNLKTSLNKLVEE